METGTYKGIPQIFRLHDFWPIEKVQITSISENDLSRKYMATFKSEFVETKIQEQRQFKMVIDHRVACGWTITFENPRICEERDKDPSIYIHGIAKNLGFRGQQFVTEIVKWARNYAKSHRKKFIRKGT